MPELADQGLLNLLDRVCRTGERHVGRNARVVLGVGADAREAFFDLTYEPRLDAGGNVIGVRRLGRFRSVPYSSPYRRGVEQLGSSLGS